jgi:hypothetical protein
MLDDAFLLVFRADHESSNVVKEEERDASAVA